MNLVLSLFMYAPVIQLSLMILSHELGIFKGEKTGNRVEIGVETSGKYALAVINFAFLIVYGVYFMIQFYQTVPSTTPPGRPEQTHIVALVLFSFLPFIILPLVSIGLLSKKTLRVSEYNFVKTTYYGLNILTLLVQLVYTHRLFV